LEAEQFSTLREAQVLVESWRRHYNTVRPHRPPTRETILPPASGRSTNLKSISTMLALERGKDRAHDAQGLQDGPT
jgi:transposase InsO family protein